MMVLIAVEIRGECTYNLAIGKKRDIWNSMERMRQIIVSTAAIAQVTMEHRLGTIITTHVFEFILEIIHTILILISIHSSASYKRSTVDAIVTSVGLYIAELKSEIVKIVLTFVAFKTGFALGADLTALPSLVLIASLTHGEGTLVTCHEELLVLIEAHIVPTDLADLAIHMLNWSRLYNEKERR
jgi:hypothetical protein